MPSSNKVVLTALLGNSLIAATKFLAAFYTGSSAMFSEAVHSVVDSSNQLILLYGIKRSKNKADAKHPFGYGKEIYFWSFIVSILILSLGSGVLFYEGLHKLSSTKVNTNQIINYIVLCLAIIFEGYVCLVAVKEFRKTKGSSGWIESIRKSKDPALFLILIEDIAALLGLFVALVSIALGDYFGLPIFDAIGSLVISLILALTAGFLGYECKGLLIGEGASKDIVSGINEILKEENGIKHVNDLLTMHFGPQDILLNTSLDFEDDMSSLEVEKTIARLENKIKNKFTNVKRIYIEAQSSIEKD